MIAVVAVVALLLELEVEGGILISAEDELMEVKASDDVEDDVRVRVRDVDVVEEGLTGEEKDVDGKDNGDELDELEVLPLTPILVAQAEGSSPYTTPHQHVEFEFHPHPSLLLVYL